MPGQKRQSLKIEAHRDVTTVPLMVLVNNNSFANNMSFCLVHWTKTSLEGQGLGFRTNEQLC